MKVKLKKLGASVLAAFTTPTAVKAEVSLGTILAVRLALFAGASAGTIELIKQLIVAVSG